MSNDAQQEFWNGPAGDVWVEAQDYMDSMLAPLSDLAIDQAQASSGERVIDVGCGCGSTSLALAQSGAQVWGIDISQQMIERAKARAAGSDHLAFSVSDAASQAYTHDHHLLFSRFGVMFFDDPKVAFTNLRTALVPGGRLVFLCWQSPRENPWIAVAGRAVQPFMPPAEEQDPRAPGPFAFADADWVGEILESAGFTEVRLDSVTPLLTLGKNADEAMYIQGRIGPMARALAELDETQRKQATQAVREALAEHETGDGVRLGSSAWLVSAVTE